MTPKELWLIRDQLGRAVEHLDANRIYDAWAQLEKTRYELFLAIERARPQTTVGKPPAPKPLRVIK